MRFDELLRRIGYRFLIDTSEDFSAACSSSDHVLMGDSEWLNNYVTPTKGRIMANHIAAPLSQPNGRYQALDKTT